MHFQLVDSRVEMLDWTLCPRGCGAEVLVGQDGLVFERRPRTVLEHPFTDEGFSVRSGFRDERGVIHVVRRTQLWFEHECPASRR